MKPDNVAPPRRIELDYYRSIRNLLYHHLNFPEGTTPENILNAFANLSTNTAVLEDLAFHMARRMVTQVKVQNARNWREAARESGRGREIFEALTHEMQGNVGTRVRDIVSENAKLISSIPGKLREDVDKEIFQLQLQGERPELISDYLLKRIPKLTRHRAALIARTETGKASTALTRARSEDLGINWYQWATSEDARVRPSHRIMDKVLVNWNDAPAPEALDGIRSTLGHYHAGNAPNCRCDSYPIVSLDQITWPAKVYTSGHIQRMTRHQFAELSGIGRRVAA